MPLDPVKVDVAMRITDRFLNMRQPSPRKPLAVLIRDGGILDEMENRSLVRAEKDRTEYFPTFSTFAILNEDDAKYIKARDGVLKVLHTLTNLYEVDDASAQYTLEQFIEHVRDRYDSIDPDEISLGLYLAIPEFGAIKSYSRSPDGTQIASFTIAEQVLKIIDPAAAWAQRVAIARNNASTPPTFEATAKTRFDDAVSEIYEPAIEDNRALVKRYENAGIAEAGHFARKAADSVLKSFRQVEGIFKSIYLDPFRDGIEPSMELLLRQILEVTLTEQTSRAQGVARNLCMSFVGPLSNRSSAIDASISNTGNKMKESLNNAITLHGMRNFVSGASQGDLEHDEPMEPEASESSNNPSVFISYAWESEALKRWVLEFAQHLRRNGIDVILDRWHLDLGDNRFQFMERAVTRSEFVLVICTPTYAEKSEERSGGVGYESNIITSSIAEKAGKQKFIPVLRSGDWPISIPVWLKFAVGCDLRGEPYSQEQFKDLLKTLHRKRADAPALGPIPSFEDEPESEIINSDEAIEPEGPFSRFLDLSDELSVKEHELLDAAVNDHDEQITYRRSNGKEILLANGKSFLESANRRTRAAWLAALRALQQRGLVEASWEDRSVYHVTDNGYKASDSLGKFVRWKTKEILLRALYMNANPDSIVIKCAGIVEVPPTFYADNVGADGHVMRSLKQDRSLWVEGVERGATDGIRWEPTDVSFTNEETGELLEFRIRGLRSTEPGSLLLETTG